MCDNECISTMKSNAGLPENESDALGYSLKSLCTLLLKRFGESDAYRNNPSFLADIDLIPLLYIREHYPLTSYIVSRDKILLSEEEASTEEEQYYLDALIEFEYYRGLSHIGAYLKTINDFVYKLIDNDDLTAIILNEYLDNYVEAKKLDLQIIDEIIEKWSEEHQDIKWLKQIKDNCLNGNNPDDYLSPYPLPAYMQYKQAWVFDNIRGYFITKKETQLEKVKEDAHKIDVQLSKALKSKQEIEERMLLIEQGKVLDSVTISKGDKIKLIVDVKNSKLYENPDYIFSKSGKTICRIKPRKEGGRTVSMLSLKENDFLYRCVMAYHNPIKPKHSSEAIVWGGVSKGNTIDISSLAEWSEEVKLKNAKDIKAPNDEIKKTLELKKKIDRYLATIHNKIRKHIYYDEGGSDKFKIMSLVGNVIKFNIDIVYEKGYRDLANEEREKRYS